MAVGLFELARVVGNGDVPGETVVASLCRDAAGDVVADRRTCGKAAVFWLTGGFTSVAGACASIENAADFFALMLLSKAVATVGALDLFMFCMLKG